MFVKGKEDGFIPRGCYMNWDGVNFPERFVLEEEVDDDQGRKDGTNKQIIVSLRKKNSGKWKASAKDVALYQPSNSNSSRKEIRADLNGPSQEMGFSISSKGKMALGHSNSKNWPSELKSSPLAKAHSDLEKTNDSSKAAHNSSNELVGKVNTSSYTTKGKEAASSDGCFTKDLARRNGTGEGLDSEFFTPNSSIVSGLMTSRFSPRRQSENKGKQIWGFFSTISQGDLLRLQVPCRRYSSLVR